VPPTRWLVFLSLIFLMVRSPHGHTAESLHGHIDALIAAKAGDRPASATADDAEFLRRIYLDLAGRIPSAREARAFLADRTPDRRSRLIDALLKGAEYPRRMQELFHAMLMERRGDHAEWTKYLRKSFATNKPWNQMAREILRAAPGDEATRGAAFFYAKRLEHYGENPIDYPGLTRDVGRLFLGRDLRCAQCHDHLFVNEYKQHDFQGLFAFFQNTYLHDPSYPTVGEKPMVQKRAFMSVFKKVKRETGPRIPNLREFDVPRFAKGQEYIRPPDAKTKSPGLPRFSPLERLAEQLPAADNPAFVRNIVNRMWFVMMGRGLVHPLDLHHADNPPSHPELLDLLAREFIAHNFDMKWLLRELALSTTYQRSSVLPEGQQVSPSDRFLTAIEKRLSAEQWMWSMLEATGERSRVTEAKGTEGLEAVRAKFVKAFANPAGEPEDEFAPSLKATLFLLNDPTIQGWLTPHAGNLVDRLAKLPPAEVAEELYLCVLTRLPTEEERGEVAKHLSGGAGRRQAVVSQLAWALLASTEFCVNH
jgi:hypothetical protein